MALSCQFKLLKVKSKKPVDKFVHKLAPGAILENQLSGTRNYRIPKEQVTLYKTFRKVEKYKEKLHITDWAITNTTLEEVFLRISEGRHEEELTKEQKKKMKYVFMDE